MSKAGSVDRTRPDATNRINVTHVIFNRGNSGEVTIRGGLRHYSMQSQSLQTFLSGGRKIASLFCRKSVKPRPFQHHSTEPAAFGGTLESRRINHYPLGSQNNPRSQLSDMSHSCSPTQPAMRQAETYRIPENFRWHPRTIRRANNLASKLKHPQKNWSGSA